METTRRIRDLIIPISQYPHMPYWATLKEAVVQLKAAYETGRRTILVFDEAYRLVGVLQRKHILKALDAEFARYGEDRAAWEGLLGPGSAKGLARQIKDFMSGTSVRIDADESILSASHVMVGNDAYLLPVTEGGKLIGVLRMDDLYQEITSALRNL